MMVTRANCPSCGAPVEFKLGASIVVICEFCNSAVARTDRDVRNLGKVADLVDTQSPLAIGVEGRFDGKPFVLTGRAQIQHQAGGVWDEWYATFGDGRTGWLAEAQGRFYMTFPVPVSDPSLLPPVGTVRPGLKGPLPGTPGTFAVSELGRARPIAAQGEIPYALVPGEEYMFADLSGDAGQFATIDYSESPPLLFGGREVTLGGIGIRREADSYDAQERRVGSVRLTCPQCGGPMDLRAPESERATCPNCNALLDVDRGNLTYLRTLETRTIPLIPLGSVAKWDEGALTTIGYMTRACVVDGITYGWEEYLLYEPRIGFRWLVHDSGHWSYVTPISVGEVFDGETMASYKSKSYKRFQAVTAYVQSVYGEFYWRVEVGECTGATDFVSAPEILSKEVSPSEITWSHGVYVHRDAIAALYQVQRPLPEPTTIGMAQPNPHRGKILPWAIMLMIAFVVGLGFQACGARRPIFNKAIEFKPLESATSTAVYFSDEFDVKANENLEVEVSAPVSNSWFYAEGDLVNVEMGLVQGFSIPVEFYSGTEGGESWSEGSPSSETHLSSLPAGRYTLRLEAQWQESTKPITANVRITQGVPRVVHWILLMAFIVAGMIVMIIVKSSFESRRWSESMFNPSSSDD